MLAIQLSEQHAASVQYQPPQSAIRRADPAQWGEWRAVPRADLGQQLQSFKDNYISPGFMTLPAAFTFGSAALNYTFRGFASYNEDMALAKSFRIKERVRCEFRWEAFNALDRVV